MKSYELNYVENDATRILLMREKHTSHQSFGFLWQGLNEKGNAPYWETSAVTLRKLFMIFIVMMFQDSNKNVQMVIALMGLFVFTAFHINVKPYDSFVHDKLEIISLVVSQATIIVVCNLIFMLYFFVNLIYHAFFMLDESVQNMINKCCACCFRKQKKKKKTMMKNGKHKSDGTIERRLSLRSMTSGFDYDYHTSRVPGKRGGQELAARGSSVEQRIQQVIEFRVPKGSGPGKKLVLKGANGERFAVIIPNYAYPGTALTFTLNPTDGGKHVRRSIAGAQDLNDTIVSLGSITSENDEDTGIEESYQSDSDGSNDSNDSELHLMI